MANIITEPRPEGDSERKPDRLLTRSEVATAFRVDPKTITRWAAEGLLKAVRLPSGTRRYRESTIRALLIEEEAC